MKHRLFGFRSIQALLSALVCLCLSMLSCTPEGLVDTSEFTLYYPGITDIGPSTNFTVSPTWHGEKPSDFKIYNVTFQGKDYQTECFTIDTETGDVSLTDTDNLPVGKYMISISCMSKGKTFQFDNAISINMLKRVPDGITVDPALLRVKLEDVIAERELPKATIITEKDHISIKGYKIASVRREGVIVPDWDKWFKVSTSGVFSIIPGDESILPGKYVFDFKLNTYIAGDDSQEGIFTDALTVDITSGPLLLTYSPSQGKVEAGYEMRSKAPVVKGSSDGLKFHIKSVIPELPDLAIDEVTGVLSIPEGNTLAIGDRYVVSVIATNFYGSKDFDDAYTITVVDFIDPITTFSYSRSEDIIQTLPVKGIPQFDGEDVAFRFKNDLPVELSGLSINAETGVISASKGNKIPVGEHSVTVVAENIKSSLETVFTFNVVPNPFYFTNVRWGNNLGLEPYADYADQFRFDKKGETYTMKVLESDIPAGAPVEWNVSKLWSQDEVTIDTEGTITVNTTKFVRPMNIIKVTAIVGGDDPAAITKDFYVFYNNYFPTPTKKFTITYTPFVFKVNPKTGGSSSMPIITDENGKDITSIFAIDSRGNFNFFCFDGKYSEKAQRPKDVGGFLNNLWTQYYKGVGGPNATVNTGARNPISAYDSNPTFRLGYYRQEDLRFVVNSDKWRDTDGNYANGVFLGEVQVDNNGKTDPITSNGPRTYAMMVWFDTEF